MEPRRYHPCEGPIGIMAFEQAVLGSKMEKGRNDASVHCRIVAVMIG